MRLSFHAIAVTVDDRDGSSEEHLVTIGGGPPGAAVAVGPVEVELTGRAEGFVWSAANRGDRPVRLRAVSLVVRLHDLVEPLRIFRHGYQSWSPSGVATFGVDQDPSRQANLPFVQGIYHADDRQVGEGELRSEWCTALVAAGPGSAEHPVVLGFDGGSRHDGTFRLRRGSDGVAELWVEAFLGGAVLEPGERRDLHGVSLLQDEGSASKGLGRWAAGVGRSDGSRAAGPFQVGWCSWYQFFDRVTEADLRRNLTLAADWPFDVFQLDDGYQTTVGDWRETNARFPSSLDRLASDVGAEGMRPGIWLAPFLAAPDSEVARRHPNWIARAVGPGDEPLRSWWNEGWGGGEEGLMYSLDTSHPEVLAHLEQLARDLVEAGFSYLKLDFAFAAAVDGRWYDPAMTPAQRVRAGFDAIRRGAGEETFLLGCGVPLANVVGVVDANRIGADVGLQWEPDASQGVIDGYLDVEPATRSAFAATLARSFMHRQLWINDPDCLMLRDSDTNLSPAAVETWSRCVGLSGGLVMISDDLNRLGSEARARLGEIVTLGRASDDEAIEGRPPVCLDLMEHPVPTTFCSGSHQLVADIESATSVLSSGRRPPVGATGGADDHLGGERPDSRTR
jgi:alpha-galactosidase